MSSIAQPRPRDHFLQSYRFWLSAYIWGSFMLLFFTNCLVQDNIYDRLKKLHDRSPELDAKIRMDESQKSQLQPDTNNRKRFHWAQAGYWIETYHERVEAFQGRQKCAYLLAVAAFGLILGCLVYMAETPNKKRRWLLSISVFMYFVAPFLMDSFIYNDIVGTQFVSAPFLFLFFVVRGIGEFNPDETLDNSTLVVALPEILKLYQQYLVTCLAVIAFIPATLFLAANSLMESIYSRKDPPERWFYEAIHHPLFAALLTFSIFGCSVLAIGGVGIFHKKISRSLTKLSGE